LGLETETLFGELTSLPNDVTMCREREIELNIPNSA